MISSLETTREMDKLDSENFIYICINSEASHYCKENAIDLNSVNYKGYNIYSIDRKKLSETELKTIEEKEWRTN